MKKREAMVGLSSRSSSPNMRLRVVDTCEQSTPLLGSRDLQREESCRCSCFILQYTLTSDWVKFRIRQNLGRADFEAAFRANKQRRKLGCKTLTNAILILELGFTPPPPLSQLPKKCNVSKNTKNFQNIGKIYSSLCPFSPPSVRPFVCLLLRPFCPPSVQSSVCSALLLFCPPSVRPFACSALQPLGCPA